MKELRQHHEKAALMAEAPIGPRQQHPQGSAKRFTSEERKLLARGYEIVTVTRKSWRRYLK